LPKYGFQKLITKLLLQSIERARANRLHFEYGPSYCLAFLKPTVYLAASIMKIIELTGCLTMKGFDECLGGRQNKQGEGENYKRIPISCKPYSSTNVSL